MTAHSPADLESRLYEAYATQHAGCGGDEAAALVYRRDYAAITATDLLEHLTKPEALQTFHDAATALAPGGVFVGRAPNAVSHQTSFTARSIRQLAAAAGFDLVLARSSPLVAYGLASAARVTIRQVVSACYRIALAAETGMLHGRIVTQNLTFAGRKGVVTVRLAES